MKYLPMNWLMDIYSSDLPAPSRLVASVLRTFMNEHRDCAWPSVGTLCKMTGLAERTIQGHLKTLQEAGWLKLTGTSDLGTNVYRLSVPAGDAVLVDDTPPHEVLLTTAGDAPKLNKELNNNICKQKRKKRFTPPTRKEVEDHWKEKGWGHSSDSFYDYYDSADWVDANGRKLIAWKRNAATWNRNNSKYGTTTSKESYVRGFDYV